ncbi:MAG: DUF4157 domain-containing protein [Saprospiraceae bacterium]
MSEPKEKLKYKSNNVLTDNDTVIESNVLGKFFPAVPFQAKSAEKNDFEEEINNETEAQENHSLNFSSAAPPDDRITNHLFPNIVRTDSGIQLKANSNYTTPLQLKPNKTKISSYSAPAFQLKTVEPTQNDSKEDDTSSVQNTSHSNSLPKDVLGNMEQMMGADFSGVNIHQNSTNAHNVGALAYTQGEDIHFAPGQFDPTSKSGKELIGHELTHVVQQRQGRVQPTTQAKGLPVNDDEGLEAEADEMGRQAAQMKANPDAPPAQMSLFGNEQERIRTKTGIKINNPTFDESRMRQELPRTSFTGAGDPRLAQAMTVLYSGATEGAEVEQSLRTIAEIRGLDVSTVNEQYNRAIAIRTAGRQYANPNGAANDANDPSPDLDLDRHPDFTGSLSQLRFGSTLGDVFGIDPVFGALISPTGGLVGPGNDSVSGDANNPTVLHGTVHDAAGYLLNAHGVGPGYNYLKRSWELDATNPLAGQTSGTAYWADRNPIAQATATLGTFGVNAVMDNPSILLGMIHPGLAVPGLMNAGRDYENNFIRSAVEVGGGNWASRGVDSISNTLNAGWNAASNLWDGVTGVASDVWDGARGVTSDVIGGMRGVASDVWSGARGVASDVWDGARGVTSDVIGGMRGVASDVWSGARGVASDVWDGARGLASGVMGGIGGALKDSGIGQPLTAPGLGGIASGLGRALSRAASGVGGALRDAGIGQPLTAPGVGGIVGGIGRALSGVTGGIGGALRDAGIGQPLTAPGVGDLFDGLDRLLSGTTGGNGGALRDAGIGQPLTAPGVGDLFDRLDRLLSSTTGGIGDALKDSGIGQPLTAPGVGGIVGGIGRALSGVTGGIGGALRDAGIGQPLTAPGLGGIVGGISRMLSGITGGLSDALKNSGIGQPLTAPGLGGLGGGIGRMLPGPKGGMGVADGIGGLLPKILGGLGLNGGIFGGLGGLLPGLLGPFGGILGGLGGLLGKGGIGQPLTAPGLGGLGGGIGRMLPGPKGGMGVAGGIGGLLPKIFGGLGLNGGISGGLGGLLPGLLGPSGGILGGLGGLLGKGGIGQPLTTPGMGGILGGLGGILGRLGRILPGITGGLSGTLKDSGIGQPLITPGLGGLGAAAGRRLSGLSDGQGDALRDAGIGQPLTTPGMGGILGRLGRILSRITGGLSGALKDSGIGQPLIAPGLDGLGAAAGQRLSGLSDGQGDALRYAGIGQPLTSPGMGGILSGLRRIINSIPEAKNVSANPTNHPGWDLPFDPFRIGGIGVPNNTPTHIPAGVGSKPEGDGYSTPWLYSGFKPSADGKYPIGYSGGFGLGRLAAPGNTNTYGAADINLGAWDDPDGGTRYGLGASAGAGKGSYDIPAIINSFYPGAMDKRNILNLDVGLGTAGADLSLNPDTGFSIGAQANIAEGAITAGTTDTGDSDKTYKLGLSEGVGAALRGHWGDKDKDGLREYGFGFDFGPLSVDMKTEDPLRDLGIGFIPGVGPALANLLPGGNLTEGLANKFGLTTRNATLADTWNLVSDTASDAWDGAKGLASDAWDSVTSTASDAWDGITNTASDAWDGVTSTASDAWDGAKGLASDAWDGAKSTASDAWDSATSTASDAWSGTKSIASDAWDGLKSLF